jgi:TetR/AcrR family transcriptional repressor of nem operon
MPRTARADAPTKEKLLDAAKSLLLTQGYAATTVDDICEAAGVTKGGFFHYFKSKEALAKTVLQRYCSTTAKQHKAACCDEADPVKRLFAYVDCMIKASQEPSTDKGCLLGTLAQEMSDTNPAIRTICAEAFKDWVGEIRTLLDGAKAARAAPAVPFDSAGLAAYFVSTLEGAMLLGKTRQDMKIVGESLKHFRRYLESYFPSAAAGR